MPLSDISFINFAINFEQTVNFVHADRIPINFERYF